MDNIFLIDNLDRTQSYALNLGIQKSRGDIIIRMDVHCIYSDYISELLKYLIAFNVDNI
jgi:hypothetical protein